MQSVSLYLSLRRQSRGTPDPFISISAHTHTHRAPAAVKNGCGRFLAGDLGGKKEEGNKTRERAQFLMGEKKKEGLPGLPSPSHNNAHIRARRRREVAARVSGVAAMQRRRRGEERGVGGGSSCCFFLSGPVCSLALRSHRKPTLSPPPLHPTPTPPPPRPRPHHALLPVRPPAGPPRPVCGCGR